MTNDFIAGCSSGIIQTVIGHPFDTLKVLMQTNKPHYKTPLHYYKGVLFPLSFNIIFTGLTFDINKRLHSYTQSHYSSGFMTGTLLSPVIFYFDIGKINKQINPTGTLSWRNFKSMNGFTATMMRESISTGVYMGLYFNMEERYGPLVSGGSAGLGSWASTYPLDVIKTRQMKNKNLSFLEYISFAVLK